MPTDADSTARAEQRRLQLELLRRARAGAAGRATAAAPDDGAPHSGRLPLSRAQRRMWLMERLGGAGDSYHVPFVTRVRGPFDPAALATALTALVARHTVLRTGYGERDGEPFQEVLPAPRAVAVPVVDASVRGAGALLREEAARPFDLAAGDAVRARVLRHGERDHTVSLTFHHIAIDGGSLEVVAGELAALYTAAAGGSGPAPLAEAPQYGDYARREHDGIPGLQGDLARWSGQLADAAPPRLPAPDASGASGAAVHTVPLAPALPEALRALGAEQRATLFAVSLTAAFAALRRLTGEDDLVIGVAGTHRTGIAMRGLVGLCVNTLPVRVDASGDPSFAELLHRVRDGLLEAQRHRHLPFDLVLERLGAAARGADGTALLRVTSDVLGEPTVLRLPGTTAEYVDVPTGGAKFTLSYGLSLDDAERPSALVQFDRAALDDDAARATVRDFAALLDSAATRPELALSEVPGLGPRGRARPEDGDDRPAAPSPDHPREGGAHPAVLALRAHPQVADAMVVQTGQGPSVAYAVLRESVGPSSNELLGLLRRSLAPESVPAAVTLLDTLPATDAGAPVSGRPSAPDGLSGARASAVVDAFASLLGGTPPPDGDFFALGGHSLIAVQLAERLRTGLGLPVTGLDVLQARTPRALAALLDERAAQQAAAKPVARPARSRAVRPGTVLVTGATGGVGAFLLRELAAQGRPVLALARPESAHLVAADGVDVVAGDLTDLDGLRHAVAGADAVIHAASTFTRPEVDLAATQAMVDAWRGGPFVFVSSVDAYGHPHGERVLEESPSHAPISPYGRAKLDCEAMVLRAAGTGGRGGASAVRSPIVWGAHERLREQLRWGALGTLYQAADRGEPIELPRPGTAGHPWYGAAWVHAAALARAVTECLERPVHGVANAVSGHVSWHDLARDLTELLGTRAEIRETDGVPQDLDHRWHYDSHRLARTLRARPGEDRRSVLAEMIGGTREDNS
ncbi:condensation domain-containing protein [Streptomyces sp. cg36]|uniref:condensation domain-containing protein n=1 Tax=Streptomyces sp. cg36 TaxID=3238798 RepID=UPI0034E201F1